MSKTFIWIHYPSRLTTGEVVAYDITSGEPVLVVPRTDVGYRDRLQAVKEELAKNGYIPPAERHKSGGKSFVNDHKFFQL